MNTPPDMPVDDGLSAALEVEQMLAASGAGQRGGSAMAASVAGDVQVCDFRESMLLSPRAQRKLRLRQEEFVTALAARLSLLLRMEFALKLRKFQTITYRAFATTWRTPTHLSLFKLEPLRGVCLLEFPLRLGAAVVDRLMGGAGRPPENLQTMSEIERVLLEQAVQVILSEWAGNWHGIGELKPVVLGYESNGHYVQTAPADTNMLVLVLDATLGECVETIQMGFPYAALEPMIQKLTVDAESAAPVANAPEVPRWNPCLDEVCLAVTAELPVAKLTARQVLGLKVGDMLPLDPHSSQKVQLCLGGEIKFTGRLGTVADTWAVEITELHAR